MYDNYLDFLWFSGLEGKHNLDNFLLYLAKLVDSGFGGNLICKKIADLNAVLAIEGRATFEDHPRVKLFRAGLKHLNAQGRPLKRPITLELLTLLWDLVPKIVSGQWELTLIRAIMTTAFHVLFHLGELVTASAGPNQSAAQVADIIYRKLDRRLFWESKMLKRRRMESYNMLSLNIYLDPKSVQLLTCSRISIYLPVI